LIGSKEMLVTATTLIDSASAQQGAEMMMEEREDGAYHSNSTKSRSSRVRFARGKTMQGVTLGNKDRVVAELGQQFLVPWSESS
jgi:hypothetical protein